MSGNRPLAKSLPSYFERANKEPELLLGALKKSQLLNVKTVILDSLTQWGFETTDRKTQKLYVPAVRLKLFEEVVTHLHLFALRRRKERISAEQQWNKKHEQSNASGGFERYNHALYNSVVKPEKEAEEQLSWLLAALTRVRYIQTVEEREEYQRELSSLNPGSAIVGYTNVTERVGMQEHFPTRALVQWILGDERCRELVDERGLLPCPGLWNDASELAKLAFECGYRDVLKGDEHTQILEPSAYGEESGKSVHTTQKEEDNNIVEVLSLAILSRAGIALIKGESVTAMLLQNLQSRDESRRAAVYRALRVVAVPVCIPDMVTYLDLQRARKQISYGSVMAFAQVATLPAEDS
ncbi:hypothetical protein CYMTET_45813 [Cymbomonas tetramitiformis]|uniref:Uncharacterized protein n=1 Tax=Cymbomonas tetramitiformis TaxID=36881 RepID=A0AAE0EZB2_9CHLO|nr:hypothetical protein CYMTET_45813 [Cymbomonas tetramitiformis]